MNQNMNASSVAEALPSMNPNLVAQLLDPILLQMITNAHGGSGFGTMLNPYYSLGPSSMPQTGANVPSSSVGFPTTYLINITKHYFAFSGCSKRSVFTSWNERIAKFKA